MLTQSPHSIFRSGGIRRRLDSHPLHQSQHLHQAPPNRLLSEHIRLIKTDVGCFSLQTHQDMPFPSQAALGTRGSETPPVSGLGWGQGATPLRNRASKRRPGRHPTSAQNPEGGEVRGMPVPVPLDPTPHPPGPLSAALERRVAGAGKCSGGGGPPPSDPYPLASPTPGTLARSRRHRRAPLRRQLNFPASGRPLDGASWVAHSDPALSAWSSKNSAPASRWLFPVLGDPLLKSDPGTRGCPVPPAQLPMP